MAFITRYIFRNTTSLLLIILVIECRAGLGRKPKYHREENGNDEGKETYQSEEWIDRPLEILLLSEEDKTMTTNEFNGKRVIRSPMDDDDIDEAENSSDDDDDEEEDSSEKKTNTTKAPLMTTAKSAVTQSVNPVAKTLTSFSLTDNTFGNQTNSNRTVTGRIPSHPSKNISIPITGKINSPIKGNRSLPFGFPPGGIIMNPGLPRPKGNSSFMKPQPNGIRRPPILPLNLLQHLSKPKPPPKKGELYLPEDYNNLVIPKLNLGKLIGINSYSAVPVLVFLNIRSVRDIDETKETVTLDLDLVIEWIDGFLFDPISAATSRQADITLNPIFLKKIWRPDVYIDEIVKVKRTSLMSKPLKLKFNPSNGFISYTTRLTVQLSCDMIYFYYPADTHRCEFTFRSYSYFSKDMELSWLGTGVYLQDPYDPNFDLQVESIDRVKLPQKFRKLTNDTFDGLKYTILARRKLSYHMVQTYLPSIFFIIITWLCFLVPARMVEARIGISMTTLLTLTSMFASVRESSPIVSYVKAIDIWIVFCIFFVFLTLLEFALLVWLRSRREEIEELKLEEQRKLQENKHSTVEKTDASWPRQHSSRRKCFSLQNCEKFSEFTDKYAFLIFSIVFVIFNVIYWSWLLTSSNYFDWSVNKTLNADID